MKWKFYYPSAHYEDLTVNNDCEVLYNAQIRFTSSEKFSEVLNNEQEYQIYLDFGNML